MIKKERLETTTRDVAQKILGEVSACCAFYFFNDINKYSGTYANSLIVFSNALTKIEKDSLNFHFNRGDFESWIRLLGDVELEKRLKLINKKRLKGEALRNKLYEEIKSRCDELRKVLY